VLLIETEKFDCIADFVLFIRDAGDIKKGRNAASVYRKYDNKTDMQHMGSNVALSDGYGYVTD